VGFQTVDARLAKFLLLAKVKLRMYRDVLFVTKVTSWPLFVDVVVLTLGAMHFTA
jgi:hypothetical protein